MAFRSSTSNALGIWMGSMATALGLDPSLPPGGNFDLSHWKLTLPYADAAEIDPAQLSGGFTNAYFFTATDGAMAFWCPVALNGSNGFPRSELRELVNPTNDNQNWTGFGSHILDAQCAVLQIPSSQKVVIGQIHSATGAELPLVKLQYNSGRVEALVKQSPTDETDTHLDFGPAEIGAPLNYELSLENGLLSVTVNGSNQAMNVFAIDPNWQFQTFFFKAGDYCQDNAGSADEGALVQFYRLSVRRSVNTNVPPVIVNVFRNSSSVGFTVVGEDAARYAIQSSSDLSSWSDDATGLCVSGSFDFMDTNFGSSSDRFYRALRLP